MIWRKRKHYSIRVLLGVQVPELSSTEDEVDLLDLVVLERIRRT